MATIPIREMSGSSKKGYHVIIDRPFGKMGAELHIMKESSPLWMLAQMDATKIVWVPFTEGETAEPLLRLHFADAVGILEALGEALRSAGIVTTDENRIVGLLEAKSDHLKDLRHLLKLPQH